MNNAIFKTLLWASLTKTMPVKFQIGVLAANSLPVMDRGSNSTDAYVEVCGFFFLSSISSLYQVHFSKRCSGKTHVVNRTLSPTWNETFTLEFTDDTKLEDSPLEFKCVYSDCAFCIICFISIQICFFRVWDKDFVASDNIIGSVVIEPQSLLSISQTQKGWFPIYDSVKGPRGNLFITISITAIRDVNPSQQCKNDDIFFSACLRQKSTFFLFVYHIVFTSNASSNIVEYCSNSRTCS